ncbi:FMN-linked oxidoreductase [Parathielavia appendiculata]|uniref:FMN-linked oxidoreductase n=1 Tax=Parathielavia appendiculata TaxID=2587402 RepID=A0AAN6U505_9PEZI|nr:FMN-linked oxidoreductase [Parathielavia appendiculata]
MAPPSSGRLFEPLRLTPNITLSHRMAMAPLTRFRSDDDHVPIVPLMATYYSQRASLPGTLLVSEATFISKNAGGYDNVPGIYTAAQVAAWKKVTDAVHARGGFIFCQLWSLGRAATAAVAAKEGFKVHSSSAVPMDEHPGTVVPEEMTVEEIKERVKEYATAAKNAIEAGFDGVEIHGANGYLIDQFIQDTCNRRGDEYGGSVENRSRFAVEVVDAVVQAVGAERTGIRLSPWSTFQGMRMKDPVPQFEDVIRKISGFGLAYLHLVQGRIAGSEDSGGADEESLGFAAKLWNGPLLIAGGLTAQSATSLVDEQFKDKNVVAVFGRWYISTPDLPFRIKEGIELNPYERLSFYAPKSPVGYIDQSFSKEYEAVYGVQTLN